MTIVPKLRIATLVAIRAAVLAGVGIAVLPDFVIRDDLRTEALRAIVPKALLAPVSAHALYRIESRGMPRVRRCSSIYAAPFRFEGVRGSRDRVTPRGRGAPPK